MADREKILSRVSPELDTFNGKILDGDFQWQWPKWLRPKQGLTKIQAEQSQKYINLIVKRDYPYQVREYMGRHLWVEFCEYWAANPDFNKAMRYL